MADDTLTTDDTKPKADAKPVAPKAPVIADASPLAGAVRGIEADPIIKTDRARVAELQQKVDAPVMTKPPPEPTPTDPLLAFGQPAMWLGLFGSLATRQHLTSAIQSAAAVQESVKKQDEEGYKRAYAQWKLDTENAQRLAEREQKSLQNAVTTLNTDTRLADAQIRNHIAEYKNEVVDQIYRTQGWQGVKDYLSAHGKQSEEMGTGANALTKKAAEKELWAAWQEANPDADARTRAVAKLAIAEGKDPDAAKGASSNWSILTDPTTKEQIRYREGPTGPQYQDLAGNVIDPPKNVAKMGAAKDAGFTPEMSQLMGEMAQLGITLPAGLRSKDQQIAAYQGVIDSTPGMSMAERAQKIKDGQIQLSAERKETQTAAAQAGRVSIAVNELRTMAPLAQAASEAVPRTAWVPLTKLLQMGDASISDPALKDLKIKTNAILNAYDQLAARGGTDAAKREYAHSLLTTAESPESYRAALKAFGQEADAAKQAAEQAERVDRGNKGGQKDGHATALPGEPIYTDKDGNRAVKRDGKWVEVQ